MVAPPAVTSVVTGRMVIRSSASPERWVSRSNPRRETISSPHHSIRAGPAIPKPYTSMIPPRTLNCATSVTVSVRAYPMAPSRSTTALSPTPSPTPTPTPRPGWRTNRIACRAAGIPVRSALARAVVTSTRTVPRSSDSTLSIRSPAISKWGSSAPSPSRWG